MDIPQIHPWTAGTLLTDSLCNEWSAVYDFLLNPPQAEVKRTSNQTITSAAYGTWTAVTFTVKVADTDGMWSASHATRLTVATPGWYECMYQIPWAVTADAAYCGGGLVLNGSRTSANILGYHDYWLSSDYTQAVIRNSVDIFMTTDDYIELLVWQNTGSNLDLDGDTVMRVTWSSC